MSTTLTKAIYYLKDLSEEKLNSAADYIKFLHEQEHQLDTFDYELAKQADTHTDLETISFNEVLREVGLTHDEISN